MALMSEMDAAAMDEMVESYQQSIEDEDIADSATIQNETEVDKTSNRDNPTAPRSQNSTDEGLAVPLDTAGTSLPDSTSPNPSPSHPNFISRLKREQNPEATPAFSFSPAVQPQMDLLGRHSRHRAGVQHRQQARHEVETRQSGEYQKVASRTTGSSLTSHMVGTGSSAFEGRAQSNIRRHTVSPEFGDGPEQPPTNGVSSKAEQETSYQHTPEPARRVAVAESHGRRTDTTQHESLDAFERDGEKSPPVNITQSALPSRQHSCESHPENSETGLETAECSRQGHDGFTDNVAHGRHDDDQLEAQHASPGHLAEVSEKSNLGSGIGRRARSVDGLAYTSVHNRHNRALSGVSDKVTSSKVTKCQPGSHRRTAPRSGAMKSSHVSLPSISEMDISEIFQSIQSKIDEENAHIRSQAAEEIQELQGKVSGLTEDNERLQNQLKTTEEQEATLKSKAREDLEAVKARCSELGTLANGVRENANSLKEAHIELLTAYNESKKEIRNALSHMRTLLQTLAKQAENSLKLRDNALDLCRDLQTELDQVQFKRDYLESQLHEKVGVLAETRDRCAQLEQQLLALTNSEDSLRDAFNAHRKAIMDKLSDLPALMDANSEQITQQLLEKILPDIQDLSRRMPSGEDELSALRSVVEHLAENWQNHVTESTDNSQKRLDASEHLKVHIDGAVERLRTIITEREDLFHQQRTNDGAFNDLKRQLTACEGRLHASECALNESKAREDQLRSMNAEQRSLLEMWKSSPAQNEDPSPKLVEITTQLKLKVAEIETLRGELYKREDEVNRLEKANGIVQEELRSSEEQKCRHEKAHEDSEFEKVKLIDEHKQKMEEHGHSLARSIETYRAQLQADNLNELQLSRKERDRALDKLKALEESFDARTKEHDRTKSRIQDDMQEKDRELELLRSANDRAEQQLEALKAEHQEPLLRKEAEEEIGRQYDELCKKSAELESELQKAAEKESSLLQQLSEHEVTNKDAQQRIQDMNTTLEQQRLDAERAATELRRRLNDANQQLDQTLKELQEAEKKQADDAARFTAQEHDLRSAWQIEKAEHAQQVSKLESDLASAREVAESAGDHFMDNTGPGTQAQQLELLKEHEQAHRRDSPTDVLVPLSQTSVLQAGVTPTAHVQSPQPRKPRKRVDRSSNRIIDAATVPAPAVLKSGPSHAAATSRGPLQKQPAAESQNTLTVGFHGMALKETQRDSQEEQPTRIVADSQESPAQTSVEPNILPETVEETQETEEPLSFAQFNAEINSLESNWPGRSATLEHMHSLRRSHLQDTQSNESHSMLQDYDLQGPQDHAANTQIHSNTQSAGFESQDQSSMKQLHRANSGSKMQRSAFFPATDDSFLDESRLEHGARGRKKLATSQAQSSFSSSPSFQKGVRTGHYQSSAQRNRPPSTAGSGRSHRSRSGSAPRDPRLTNHLASRTPSNRGLPKRKAEGLAASTHEDDRKKRPALESRTPNSTSRPPSSSRSVAQSIKDLPRIPDSQSSQVATSTRRLRTYAGNGTRSTRRKSSTKNDEFSARFSAELRDR